MKETNKHIVVVGGGFAGINFTQAMYNNPDYKVTVVDQNNYNFFPPLLYQVATGFLETSNISFPFRNSFRVKQIFIFDWESLSRLYQLKTK